MNKEDIVLVIYVNVGQKPIPEVKAYMEKLQKDVEHKTDKFTSFFVPIRSGDTRIDCINPILLNKKDYDVAVSKILVDYQLKLEEFLSKPEPKVRGKNKVTPEPESPKVKEKTPIKKVVKPEPPPSLIIKDGSTKVKEIPAVTKDKNGISSDNPFAVKKEKKTPKK